MSEHNRLKKSLREVQRHLIDELVPFWLRHGADPQYGGFLTHFDVRGKPTGNTLKTLTSQTEVIYSASAVHRENLGEGRFLSIAEDGLEFLLQHFWDDDCTGWFQACDRVGTPTDLRKCARGHAYVIYALSEYAMASGDIRSLEMARETYICLTTLATDTGHGGFHEVLAQDWSVPQNCDARVNTKSIELYTNLVTAFANLYEASGDKTYYDDITYILSLILHETIHPEFGIAPAPNQAPEVESYDLGGRTSYGHNLQFAWVLKHVAALLDLPLVDYEASLRRQYDHSLNYGIDWENGGVFSEGPFDGPADNRHKSYWQQAAALIAFLDAYEMFHETKYLDAYENVHDLILEHVVDHRVVEWRPVLDEYNQPIANYLCNECKANGHTMRAMIQCEHRLSRLLAGFPR